LTEESPIQVHEPRSLPPSTRLAGSTPFLDEGYAAFASRSTVLGGSAVFEAANALLAKIRDAAGARSAVPWGCPSSLALYLEASARAVDIVVAAEAVQP
jgi:CO/xanthine dehydrogenase Mo-binding subunit